MEVKWIKLSADIFENPKIVIISEQYGDEAVLVWIKLLTLAGRLNNSGKFSIKNDINFDIKTIAKMIKISEKKLRKYIQIFSDFSMIICEKKLIKIANWDKYQSEEKLEKMRQQTRNRVQKYREKREEKEENKDRYKSVTVTQCNATDIDIDKDIEERKERNIKERKEKTHSLRYEDILSSVSDNGLRELYFEYIKMRKMIKAPMTNRALSMLIERVNDIEPLDVERRKKMLEEAIVNNWKSVYPLKESENTSQKKKKSFANAEKIDTEAAAAISWELLTKEMGA